MLRIAGYAAAFLAILLVLFVVVLMVAMALYGVAIVRTNLFAMFVTSYVLVGAPAALVVAIWLGSRKAD